MPTPAGPQLRAQLHRDLGKHWSKNLYRLGFCLSVIALFGLVGSADWQQPAWLLSAIAGGLLLSGLALSWWSRPR